MLSEYKQSLKCVYRDKKASLKGEVERQTIHLFTGIALILLIQISGALALPVLLFLLSVYVIISFVILSNKLPDLLSTFLCRWGRPSKQTIPLKGSILILCGITLSYVLFPENIVYASIAILAFGDSIATAMGVLMGRHKLPYSDKKTVEGTLSGTIAAFLAASFFVSPVQALVGSAGGMLLESIIDLQNITELNSKTFFKFFLNDNFLIPVFSCLIMYVIGPV